MYVLAKQKSANYPMRNSSIFPQTGTALPWQVTETLSPHPMGHLRPAPRTPLHSSPWIFMSWWRFCQKQQQEWQVWDRVTRTAAKCPKAAGIQVNSGTALDWPRGCRGSCWDPFISCSNRLPRAVNILKIYTATARAELVTIKHWVLNSTEFRKWMLELRTLQWPWTPQTFTASTGTRDFPVSIPNFQVFSISRGGTTLLSPVTKASSCFLITLSRLHTRKWFFYCFNINYFRAALGAPIL